MSLLWIALLPAWAQDAPTLADEAVRANPSVAAMARTRDALAERARVAGAWPDPVLSVEYSNAPVNTLSISDHPMGGVQLKVQQMLRPPRWSASLRTLAEHRTDASTHELAEQQLQLRASVARTWWALARTRQLRAVTETHLKRTDELQEAVRSRYEVGQAGQHAILRLQVLRDKLSDQLHDFDRTDRELTAALSGALASGPRAFETPAVTEPVPAPSPEGWLDLAEQHRPLLAALERQVEVHEAASSVARLEGRIDPTLVAGYRVRTVTTATDPGVDLASIGIAVPLPTGSGRRSGAERAAHDHEAHAAALMGARARDDIEAQAAMTHARWARAAQKAATYTDSLIPSAEAALETTQADFAVGKAEFSSLFEAEVTLLDLDRARITATIETHLQQVAANALLGTDPGAQP